MYVSFEEWTGQRTNVCWGTNSGSRPLPFQNWRKFKEAFAPELIERAIRETSQALGRPVRSAIDPFAGSGTTLLASQFLGVAPAGIEVNPYLADLVEAKLTPLDGRRAARALSEVLASAGEVDASLFYAGAPATFVEPGVKGRYLFSTRIANRLAGLLKAILGLRDPNIRRLFRVLLGSAALDVCNAVVSGKGRRYRKNWEQYNWSPADLDAAFVQAVEGAIYDAVRYSARQCLNFTLLRGDARRATAQLPQADVAIFSPPYPNSFDYTDVYNIELWVLGYLTSSTENTSLRMETLRSHVQIKRDMAADAGPPVIQEAISSLRSAPKLWNRSIPDMIGAYFADLGGILSALRLKLPSNGRIYMVVGDSRYSGVDIPVAQALHEMAPELGFDVSRNEPFRSMRSSPQQGGRAELAESLLVLVAT